MLDYLSIYHLINIGSQKTARRVWNTKHDWNILDWPVKISRLVCESCGQHDSEYSHDLYMSFLWSAILYVPANVRVMSIVPAFSVLENATTITKSEASACNMNALLTAVDAFTRQLLSLPPFCVLPPVPAVWEFISSLSTYDDDDPPPLLLSRHFLYTLWALSILFPLSCLSFSLLVALPTWTLRTLPYAVDPLRNERILISLDFKLSFKLGRKKRLSLWP